MLKASTELLFQDVRLNHPSWGRWNLKWVNNPSNECWIRRTVGISPSSGLTAHLLPSSSSSLSFSCRLSTELGMLSVLLLAPRLMILLTNCFYLLPTDVSVALSPSASCSSQWRKFLFSVLRAHQLKAGNGQPHFSNPHFSSLTQTQSRNEWCYFHFQREREREAELLLLSVRACWMPDMLHEQNTTSFFIDKQQMVSLVIFAVKFCQSYQ